VSSIAVGSSPSAIAFGDVNADGKIDIVTANGDNTVTALIGNGSGGFVSGSPVAVGNAPSSIALADMNSDGKLDAVTSNFLSNDVSVVYGNGSGGFTPGATAMVGGQPRTIAVGDLDNAQVIDEDTNLFFNSANNNTITLSDIDAGAGAESVTLGVAHGTLTLATTSGLTVVGNGSGSVSLTGTVSAINAALDGLKYTPTADYNGVDMLSVHADDNGFSGTGGALTDDLLVPIHIAPVDDFVI
jgi:hypothetical protein